MTLRRSKAKQEIVNAARKMPPLYHTIPGEEFSLRKARTLWWLVKQPSVLKFIWDIVKQSGAIQYDPQTRKWTGVDFVRDENDS